ncbi:MAG: DUF5808 domain-containing protein [Clostridiales bacterium]|nr:DUF5808 domain-containing protein [Clostridiales bacterium]
MMLIWTLVFVDVLLIVCLAFMPFLTRKTELFGVSIPSKEYMRRELVGMRRGYRNIMVIVGLALMGAHLLFQLNPALNGGLTLEEASGLAGNGGLRFVAPFIVTVCVYCVFGFLLYLHYHKCMKNYKEQFGWSEAGQAGPVIIADTEPAGRESISFNWLWLYAFIAAVSVIAVIFIWPYVPDRVVTNTGLDGTPDAWVDKGPGAVLPLLASQWFLMVTFALCLLIVRHARRQIDPAAPEASREQGRRFRRISSVLLFVCGAAFGILMGVLNITMLLGVNLAAYAVFMLVAFAVIIIVMIAILIRVGQGGSRLAVRGVAGNADKTADTGAANAPVDNDAYWKLGQFYFNRNDPAIFVEKRFGIGWTMNWGHPVSWLIIAAVVVVIVAVLIASGGQSTHIGINA